MGDFRFQISDFRCETLPRRGVTLLEVLFAIFVSAVGLLGLASLIPVGKVLLVDATKADRSAACGQSALAEIQTRNFLRVVAGEPWVDTDADSYADPGEFTDLNGDGVYSPPVANPVVLDALMVSRNATGAEYFPYYGWPGDTDYPANAPGPLVARGSPWPYLAAGTALHASLANRVFTWRDDLVFTVPDGDERPQQLIAGTGAVAPVTGDYTWLATIAPSSTEHTLANGTRSLFTVSVAVFYKRRTQIDMAAPVPGERMCLASFIGGGLAGGDVALHLPTTANDAPDEYFKVRPNQWLLLIGWAADPSAPAGTPFPGGAGRNRPVLRWYRISAVATEDPTANGFDDNFDGTIDEDFETGRSVTLSGSDWIASELLVDTDDIVGSSDVTYDADSDTVNGFTVECVLFDDCTGVYEKTIAIDQPSLWSF